MDPTYKMNGHHTFTRSKAPSLITHDNSPVQINLQKKTRNAHLSACLSQSLSDLTAIVRIIFLPITR